MEIKYIYKLFEECNFNVCTDTRNIIPDSLFIALRGERYDANFFIDDALQHGCKYAIGESYKGKNDRVILVNNSLEILQKLANFHRHQMKAKIIAIAGSNGKTTTKELLASVLSKKYSIAYTKGNYNNHIGVPLTLLQIKPENELAIVEMGANHANELVLLCEIADPDYGIVTNIGKEHLGEFGSFEAVIETETYLYKYLGKKNGYAFVCADDSLLLKHSMHLRRSLYGTCDYCDVKLLETKLNPFLSIKCFIKDLSDVWEIKSNFFGKYNAENILASICAGRYFNVPVSQIVEALESYVPQNHRSQWMKLGSNNVIMDGYNANPSSMQVALDSFFEIDMPNKVVILGDMLELGSYEDEEHINVLRKFENTNNLQLYLVGKAFLRVISRSSIKAKAFLTVDYLINELKQNPIRNSTVFIKGSHGIHLEKIIDVLNES